MPPGLRQHWDVFISHADAESEVAAQLAAALGKAGFTCWLDKKDLEEGARYEDRIRAGIRGSRVFVLLVSRRALDSQYVRHEASQAAALDRPRLPVFLERPDYAQFTAPFKEIGDLHGVRLYESGLEAAGQRLVQAVRRQIRHRRVRTAMQWVFLPAVLTAAALTLLHLSRRPAPPAPPPPGLTVAARGWAPGQDSWQPLEAGEDLPPGGQVEFRVATSTSGHLYAWYLDATNGVNWLFPRNPASPLSSGRNPVPMGTNLVFPPIKANWTFEIGPGGGREQFHAVLSRRAWPELERALGDRRPVEVLPPQDTSTERGKGIVERPEHAAPDRPPETLTALLQAGGDASVASVTVRHHAPDTSNGPAP